MPDPRRHRIVVHPWGADWCAHLEGHSCVDHTYSWRSHDENAAWSGLRERLTRAAPTVFLPSDRYERIEDPRNHPLYNAVAIADARWSRSGRALFGSRWGDARYTEQAKGEPGSQMRTLHDTYHAARIAWHDAGTPMRPDLGDHTRG